MGQSLYKAKKFLLVGCATCLVILAISLSTALRKQDTNTLFIDPKNKIEANAKIQGFSFIQTQDGKDNWKIQAQQASLFEEQEAFWLDELTVEFEADEGWELSLSGKRGRLKTETHDFEILHSDRDVEMVLNQDYKIVTKSMRWQEEGQKIYSSDPVFIQGPSIRILGTGLEASLILQQLRVLSDVRAEIY